YGPDPELYANILYTGLVLGGHDPEGKLALARAEVLAQVFRDSGLEGLIRLHTGPHGVRDGTLYVYGVAKVPGIPPRYAKLINLMWFRDEADGAVLKDEAGIQENPNSLRSRVSRCNAFLRQAGVGWTLGTHVSPGERVCVVKEKCPIP